MSSSDPPTSALRPFLERLTGPIAIVGGILALAVAGLVVVSVLGRWLLSMPVEGDFEYVKIATAIGVFAYLPYTQARRGNIMVDTFTGWMGQRARDWLDAFWDLAYAAIMAVCAWGLFTGARDALRTGETTMQVQLVVWPGIALCAMLCTLLVLTCIGTIVRLTRGSNRGAP